MSKKPKQFILRTAIAVIAASVSLFSTTSHAATGTLYLSPGTGSVQVNSNISLTVRLNPGTNVTGVEAAIGYDTSRLQFVSADASGSPFDIELKNTGGSGRVSISRGKFSAVSSDSLVSRVTFKAIAAGATGVSMSGNASDTNGQLTNPGVSGATVTVTSPSVTPPTPPATPTPPAAPSTPSTPSTPRAPSTTKPSSGSSGSNNSGTTSRPSTSPSTPPSTTPTAGQPQTATEVSVSKSVYMTGAKFLVTSTVPVKSYLVYGVDGALNLQTAPTELGTEHNIIPLDATLEAGTAYSYKVISIDQNGVQTETDVETFRTTGYNVRVSLTSGNKKPLANKTVTIHSSPQTGKTDSAGAVSFKGLTAGQHTVTYKAGDKTYSEKILVQDTAQTAEDGSQSAATQNFSVVYKTLAIRSYTGLYISLAVLALLALIIALVVKYRHKFSSPVHTTAFAPTATPYVQDQTNVPANPFAQQQSDIDGGVPPVTNTGWPTNPTPSQPPSEPPLSQPTSPPQYPPPIPPATAQPPQTPTQYPPQPGTNQSNDQQHKDEY